MKKSNEQKNNLLQRLLISTLSKLTKENEDNQTKLSDEKFKYELPDSFIKAVDYARVRAGYDILTHRRRHQYASPLNHRNRSSSSSLSSSSSSSSARDKQSRTKPKFSLSSSTNDIDKVSIKKIQFRRVPHGHPPPPHHHQARPRIFISPRPTFPMVMNPNFMLVNKCHRPPNIIPIRNSVPMRPPQFFRMRFR